MNTEKLTLQNYFDFRDSHTTLEMVEISDICAAMREHANNKMNEVLEDLEFMRDIVTAGSPISERQSVDLVNCLEDLIHKIKNAK